MWILRQHWSALLLQIVSAFQANRRQKSRQRYTRVLFSRNFTPFVWNESAYFAYTSINIINMALAHSITFNNSLAIYWLKGVLPAAYVVATWRLNLSEKYCTLSNYARFVEHTKTMFNCLTKKTYFILFKSSVMWWLFLWNIE